MYFLAYHKTGNWLLRFLRSSLAKALLPGSFMAKWNAEAGSPMAPVARMAVDYATIDQAAPEEPWSHERKGASWAMGSGVDRACVTPAMAPKFDPNEVKIVFLSCLGGARRIVATSRSQARLPGLEH